MEAWLIFLGALNLVLAVFQFRIALGQIERPQGFFRSMFSDGPQAKWVRAIWMVTFGVIAVTVGVAAHLWDASTR